MVEAQLRTEQQKHCAQVQGRNMDIETLHRNQQENRTTKLLLSTSNRIVQADCITEIKPADRADRAFTISLYWSGN